YTWVSWFFRRFVREKRVFTIEEAVHKLSAAPTDRLGLTERGRIQAGLWADLVVFDPAHFEERGTLEAPNQLAGGGGAVLGNRVVSWEKGRLTGTRGGRVLRRG